MGSFTHKLRQILVGSHTAADFPPPLLFLPDGFSVRQAGETGISIVENFCTAAEANYIIDTARGRLRESLITIDEKRVRDEYRRSQTANVFDPANKDPALLPLLYRAGMLLGLPFANIESVYVTRYQEGEYYKAHKDYTDGFEGDRLFTVLIYLNDMQPEHGGGTVFNDLNIGVSPRLGRAVIWCNTNPDGSHHTETSHEALPVTHGGEKWAIQLWYRSYSMITVPGRHVTAPQSAPQPLTNNQSRPAGTWCLEPAGSEG